MRGFLEEASRLDHTFYPRGRVMYDKETGRFLVMTAAEAMAKPKIRARILSAFQLDEAQTDFQAHAHYENFTADL